MWADLGLNRLTERRYRRIVQRVGFEHIDYRLHISGNLTFMRYIPGLRNFFIQGINDVLRRTDPLPVDELAPIASPEPTELLRA